MEGPGRVQGAPHNRRPIAVDGKGNGIAWGGTIFGCGGWVIAIGSQEAILACTIHDVVADLHCPGIGLDAATHRHRLSIQGGVAAVEVDPLGARMHPFATR